MNQHDNNYSIESIIEIISLISEEAKSYLNKVNTLPIQTGDPHELLSNFTDVFPETGHGAVQTLKKLIQEGIGASVTSTGPRFFHFVTGGTNPTALGADWFATTIDQNAFSWVSSPLATKLEVISIKWLIELFGLPETWAGSITTGTTMSNFVCLGAARQWFGEQYTANIAEDGFKNVPPIPIFSSEIIHPSDVKALGMLGIGRANHKRIPQKDSPTFDIDNLEEELRKLNGDPCIIIGVAGEPNAGEFDPIEKLAELAKQYNAWLHVDGAFGIFAQLSKDKRYLTTGVEKAHSVAVDGHKWLNVPYDCGFAFVYDHSLLVKNFTFSAEYLPDYDDKEPVLGLLTPEMSRRGRSLSVWATLFSYGKTGITKQINSNIALAQYLGELVKQNEKLELLAEVLLNVVCFRFNDKKHTEKELDEINSKLGTAIIHDRRVFLGTTTYKGKIALRPAISNWRTQKVDIELIIQVVEELGSQIVIKHDN